MEIIKTIVSSEAVRVGVRNPLKWFRDLVDRRKMNGQWLDSLVNQRLLATYEKRQVRMTIHNGKLHIVRKLKWV